MIAFKDRPIQGKITWVIMVTTIVSLLIAGTTLLIFDIGDAQDKLGRELSSIGQIIAANSAAALEFDDPKAAEAILSALQQDKRITAAALFRETGESFAVFVRASDTEATVPTKLPAWGILRESGYLKLVLPVSVAGRTVGGLYLQATMSQIQESLREYAMVLSLAILFSSLGAYLLSFRLRNLISRPIIRLSETALSVAQRNDYTLRVEKEGNDEIGVLIDRFNEMLSQIRTQNSALKDSEHQLRLITDSLPVLISYIDRDQRFRFNNALYQEWFRTDRAVLFGRHFAEVVSTGTYDAISRYLTAALEGAPQTFETVVDFPDGVRRTVASSYVPDFSEDGTVRGIFALVTDISDRKKAETELKMLNELLEQRVAERTKALATSQEQLRHSERLASIGTLAAGIAHEINNPINSILLASQYALKYSNIADDKLKETFVNIADESKRCGRIIRNVLQFAKAEKTKKWAQDINEVVERAADLAKKYIRSNRLDIEMHLTRPLPLAEANSTEIEQVLVNLIENAAEASTMPVQVVLTTEVVDSRIRIRVKDNGPGIPEALQKHIFDPFYSTRREQGGTGLGLSIAHGIIMDHGGAMSVLSHSGTGTEFLIDLNIAEQAGEHGKSTGR